jgi:hypothetical protein
MDPTDPTHPDPDQLSLINLILYLVCGKERGTCRVTYTSFTWRARSVCCPPPSPSSAPDAGKRPPLASPSSPTCVSQQPIGHRHPRSAPRAHHAGVRALLYNFRAEEGPMTAAAPSHSWLCDVRLLHLTDAASPANLALFQYQWARGQPVQSATATAPCSGACGTRAPYSRISAICVPSSSTHSQVKTMKGSGSGSGSRRLKMTNKNRKKI